jgi:hypothetical protein
MYLQQTADRGKYQQHTADIRKPPLLLTIECIHYRPFILTTILYRLLIMSSIHCRLLILENICNRLLILGSVPTTDC